MEKGSAQSTRPRPATAAGPTPDPITAPIVRRVYADFLASPACTPSPKPSLTTASDAGRPTRAVFGTPANDGQPPADRVALVWRPTSRDSDAIRRESVAACREGARSCPEHHVATGDHYRRRLAVQRAVRQPRSGSSPLIGGGPPGTMARLAFSASSSLSCVGCSWMLGMKVAAAAASPITPASKANPVTYPRSTGRASRPRWAVTTPAMTAEPTEPPTPREQVPREDPSHRRLVRFQLELQLG